MVFDLDKYKVCFQRGAENVKDGLTLEQMKEQQTSWGQSCAELRSSSAGFPTSKMLVNFIKLVNIMGMFITA